MENEQAVEYLSGLLGKTLRVQLSDRRMFVGQMRCTDQEQNIILANTHEYREPSVSAVTAAAQAATAGPTSDGKDTFSANMTSRFVGLVVCPGQEITKVEVEEFVRPQ